MDSGLEESFRQVQSHAQNLRGPHSMRTGPTSFQIPRFAPGTAVDTPVQAAPAGGMVDGSAVQQSAATQAQSLPMAQAYIPAQAPPTAHLPHPAHPSGIPAHPGLPQGTRGVQPAVTTPAMQTPLDQKYAAPGSLVPTQGQVPPPGEAVAEPKKKSKLWLWVAIGAAVVVVIVIVVVVFKKKRSSGGGSSQENDPSSSKPAISSGSEEDESKKDKEPKEIPSTEHKPSEAVKNMSSSIRNRIEAALQSEIASARSGNSTIAQPAGPPAAAGNTVHAPTPTDASVLDHTGPLPPLQPSGQPRGPPPSQAMPPPHQPMPPQPGTMPPRPPPGATAMGQPIGGIRAHPGSYPPSPPVANPPRATSFPGQGMQGPPPQPPPMPGGNMPRPPMPPPPRPTVPYAGAPMTGSAQPAMPAPNADPLGTPL